MGFFNDDTVSSTVLQSNTWYHSAFVYDNNQRQQFIYINGLPDTQSGTGVGPYLGTSEPTTIGVPYLSGIMDHLTVSTRAKTACEILNNATLVAYFPFDGSLTDAGPNFLTEISSGASITSGYVNQAVIQLNTWTHMVQTYSPTNGQSLYVNGILYTTLSNATIYTASGVQNYVTIGNLLNVTSCYNPGILQTPIQGIIDELRIYSRELSSTDACPLAWPYIGNCSFFLSYMFVLPLLFSFTSTCRMKYNY